MHETLNLLRCHISRDYGPIYLKYTSALTHFHIGAKMLTFKLNRVTLVNMVIININVVMLGYLEKILS